MRFGVRECANITFKAKYPTYVGKTKFVEGQPVLYIDTAKTSTLEGASTTVYATGGRGNTKLITWEGEKTLTFTVEDALLSPISFAMLSGAGLFSTENDGAGAKAKIHTTTVSGLAAGSEENQRVVNLSSVLGNGETIASDAPVFVMVTEEDGSLTGTHFVGTVDGEGKKITINDASVPAVGTMVFVDYYVEKETTQVEELQIDAEHFAGNYYVEADTLFRTPQGVDLPANLTLPNVKIQSNFTFSMASTGDPSTFTFTMDAMPDYTYFDKSKKVLCVLQVIKADAEDIKEGYSVMTGAAVNG